jgi:hypothetical protein
MDRRTLDAETTQVAYWYGGRFSVNGEEHVTTLQSNSRLGVTASVPLGSHQSLKISYSDGVVVHFGGDFKIVSVGSTGGSAIRCRRRGQTS